MCKNRIKFILFLLLLTWFIIWIIILNGKYELNSMVALNKYLLHTSESGYIVKSSKCQIVDLDAFNKEAIKFYKPENYEPCTTRPLLTYITNIDNVVTLNVDKMAVSSYQTSSVVCCYSNVTRKESTNRGDDDITTTECYLFKDSIRINHDTVSVRCYSKERHIIYENTHTTIIPNEEVKKKMTTRHSNKQISVLLIGIEGISRLNFIRALPKTYNFVENTGWIPLKGYNKVNDIIRSSLITVLSGQEANNMEAICDPQQLGLYDECPLLWNDYEKLGFITSYAEDECEISTFNYKKNGFNIPPTDFYFRPYMIASEKLTTKKKQAMTYCTGPQTSGERIFDLAKNFAVTFKEYPHFGVYWMNSFSRNQLNTVSGMDEKIRDFLEFLTNENILEHSVVVFFSDHGVRFGDIRLTQTGWLEEKLPFIYVSFPSWFKKTFPTEFNNFKINSNRLTSPYDLHMTLQHLLVLSGNDYVIKQSPGCPKCQSLLEEVDVERSCEEAGIGKYWQCSCFGYTQITLDKNVEKEISTRVVDKIHKIIESYNEAWMCARYFVNNTISTSVSQKFWYTNDTYLLIRFQTVPTAIFESTIKIEGDINDLNFSISGPISRLDRYYPYSNCVDNEDLKKYCYCLR